MTPSKIRMAMAAMADPNAKANVIVEALGITTSTLYEYVGSGGSPEQVALDVLEIRSEEAWRDCSFHWDSYPIDTSLGQA